MSSFRVLAVAALAVMSAAVSAQPVRLFSMAALKAAQANGQPVLVDAFAPWCPTCRAQAPTIDAPSRSHGYDKLVILRLDYDNQLAEKKALGIRQQSTLILFRGGREVGRTLGVTNPAEIRGFVATAL